MMNKIRSRPINVILAALQIVMLTITAVGVLTLTGCPKGKSDAIRAAVDASYRLPAATNDLIAKIREARDRGIITDAQARSFGEKLNVLAKAEVKFVEMVKIAVAASKAVGVLDDIKRLELRDYFDASVVNPFLEVLTLTNVLSGPNAAMITAGVSGVRLLLRTIGGGLGSKIQNLLSGPGIVAGRGELTAAIFGGTIKQWQIQS